MGEQSVRGVLLHGQLPRGADDARGARDLAAARHGARRHLHVAATTRPGQTVLRVHGVLGLPDVVAIPRDLVRQPAGGDVFHLLPVVRSVASRRYRRLPARVPASFHRITECEAEKVRAHDDRVRAREPGRDLARALPRGRAIDQSWRGPGHRRAPKRSGPLLRWSVLPLVGMVRGPLSHHLPSSRRECIGAGTPLSPFRFTTHPTPFTDLVYDNHSYT